MRMKESIECPWSDSDSVCIIFALVSTKKVDGFVSFLYYLKSLSRFSCFVFPSSTRFGQAGTFQLKVIRLQLCFVHSAVDRPCLPSKRLGLINYETEVEIEVTINKEI